MNTNARTRWLYRTLIAAGCNCALTLTLLCITLLRGHPSWLISILVLNSTATNGILLVAFIHYSRLRNIEKQERNER